jgi:hypothetical protein
VLGILTVSVEFYMELSYESATGNVKGRATLSVCVEVLFFSQCVDLTVERTFAGAAPTAGLPLELQFLGTPAASQPTFADTVELPDWEDYWRAFAA